MKPRPPAPMVALDEDGTLVGDMPRIIEFYVRRMRACRETRRKLADLTGRSDGEGQSPRPTTGVEREAQMRLDDRTQQLLDECEDDRLLGLWDSGLIDDGVRDDDDGVRIIDPPTPREAAA